MITDRNDLLDHPSFRAKEIREAMASLGFPHGCKVYRIEDIRKHQSGELVSRLRPHTVYGLDEITQAMGDPCDIKNLYTFIFNPGFKNERNFFSPQFTTSCSSYKNYITEARCLEEDLI